MATAIEFWPPTIIFSEPFTGETGVRTVRLTNSMTLFPVIFQARMMSEQTEFAVDLVNGFGSLLPHQSVEVTVRRIADRSPRTCSETYDTIIFYWRYLKHHEGPLISNPNPRTLQMLWNTLKKREIALGVVEVPIEIFNTRITRRPFPTWKDSSEWTPFTYRPGIGDRAALFKPEGSVPITGGAFGALWKCQMKFEGEEKIHPVAVKEIKLTQAVMRVPVDRSRILQRAEKELSVWKQLDHPNVGALIGCIFEPSVSLMSPWYPNGHVLAYVQALDHLTLVKQRVVRWELVKEMAEGMTYLHSKNVVHGDLRHDQVLVDADGHAKIVDFGLAKVIEEGVDTNITTSIRHKGHYQYMAPELMEPTPPRLKESDVYAFGILMLEVTIARLAFDGFAAGPAEVARNMGAGSHLPQPARFKAYMLEKSPFWDTFGQCTVNKPYERPVIVDVLAQVKAVPCPLGTIFVPFRE